MEIGQKFGRLTLIKLNVENKSGAWHSLFRCECGEEKVFSNSNVRLGKSRSCGCYVKDYPSQRTHGMSGTDIYQTWNRMLSRCYNPKIDRYPNYGGRGIKVCERWKKFVNFYADMGDRPSKNHSIGRIDNDGDYEPGNVRWELEEEQIFNKTNTAYTTYKGEVMAIGKAAKQSGIPYYRLSQRVHAGMSEDKLYKKEWLHNKPITACGETKLTTEWMKSVPIPISSFYMHQRKGLTPEQIVEKYVLKQRELLTNP
jgi:hypothetical protein